MQTLKEMSLDRLQAELSRRLSVDSKRLGLFVTAAARFSDNEAGIIRRLVEWSELDPKRCDELSRHFMVAFDEAMKQTDVDPLAAVDDPMSPSEKIAELLESDRETDRIRRKILEDCVDVETASAFVHRSRQNLEALRRAGRVLALRVQSQWRYPRWQFDPDRPGGIVPGIGEVLRELRLSPVAQALWFTAPCPGLAGAVPIDMLRRGEHERVARVAEELGTTP